MFSDVASKQSLKKTSLKKHRKTTEFEDLGNFDADIQVENRYGSIMGKINICLWPFN